MFSSLQESLPGETPTEYFRRVSPKMDAAMIQDILRGSRRGEAELSSARHVLRRQLQLLANYEQQIDRALTELRISPEIANEERLRVAQRRIEINDELASIESEAQAQFTPIVSGRSISAIHEKQLLREKLEQLDELIKQRASQTRATTIDRLEQQNRIIDTLLMIAAREILQTTAEIARLGKIVNDSETSESERRRTRVALAANRRQLTQYIPERQQELLEKKETNDELINQLQSRQGVSRPLAFRREIVTMNED